MKLQTFIPFLSAFLTWFQARRLASLEREAADLALLIARYDRKEEDSAMSDIGEYTMDDANARLMLASRLVLIRQQIDNIKSKPPF